MHIKAVPAAAMNAVKAHPAIIGGAGILAVGGVLYLRRKGTTQANDNGSLIRPAPVDGSASIGSQLQAALAAIGGMVNSSVTGGPSGATVDTGTGTVSLTSAPSAPIASNSVDLIGATPTQLTSTDTNYTQQLLDLQKLQINDNYVYQMSQLQLTAAISATNAFLTNQSLNSANYGMAVGLAQSFLYADRQASMGVITGPDGSPLIDFSMIQAANSNKNGWDSNLATMINNGTFANFWNQTGISSGTTPAKSAGPSNALPDYFSAFLGTGGNFSALPSAPASTTTSVTTSQPAPQSSDARTITDAPVPVVYSPSMVSSGYTAPSITSLPQASLGGGGGSSRNASSQVQEF